MVGVLCYHKNLSIYPTKWIDEYRESIRAQTIKDFQIFELDYGRTGERIFDESMYFSTDFPTFVDGMNFLLDHLFSLLDFPVVFNSNVDDVYATTWMESQAPYVLEHGYDIVSSNFCLLKDDRVVKYHQDFHARNILAELEKGHNIISHPSVCYSPDFWKNNRYNPDEIPLEDMKLWHRAILGGASFNILKDNLLFHRIHDQSVCQSNNR